MQYIMTLIWSVLLVSMLTFVVSSVMAVEPNMINGLIMSIPVAIIIFIIGAIIPDEPTVSAKHH